MGHSFKDCRAGAPDPMVVRGNKVDRSLKTDRNRAAAHHLDNLGRPAWPLRRAALHRILRPNLDRRGWIGEPKPRSTSTRRIFNIR